MAKNTHHRQLRRKAQRLRAERMAERRKRRATLTKVAAIVVAFGLTAGGFLAFSGGQPEDLASPTPDASETTEPSPTPFGVPGEAIGTVEPYLPLADETACGASPPMEASLPKPQFSAPAEVLEDNTKYYATITTSCGEVVVKLLPETAPQTVNSFVFLAQEGYFDGQIFHRLDSSIDVVQGGDPTGTGTGGPGYTIPDEITGSDTYGPGTLAMANAGANTGGSQFFFITGENGHLLDDSPNYTVFGEVVEGLDVLQQILGLPIQDPSGATGIEGQRPVQAIYIESVVISNG